MDDITGTIVRLIKETDLTHRDDLLLEARRAFLDYLASLYRAVGRQKVKAAAHWAQGFAGKGLMVGQKGTSYPIFAAFITGLLPIILTLMMPNQILPVISVPFFFPSSFLLWRRGSQSKTS